MCPTLDDAPILPQLTALAAGDLVHVCDVSASSGKKAKTISAEDLIETALDALPVSDGVAITVGDFYVDSVTGVVTKNLS